VPQRSIFPLEEPGNPPQVTHDAWRIVVFEIVAILDDLDDVVENGMGIPKRVTFGLPPFVKFISVFLSIICVDLEHVNPREKVCRAVFGQEGGQ
jgi:hypothetical protein